jgi:hypothetical protein
MDAKHAVGVEIDAGHVALDCLVGERALEAHAPVLRRQSQEVRKHVLACGRPQTLDDRCHARRSVCRAADVVQVRLPIMRI